MIIIGHKAFDQSPLDAAARPLLPRLTKYRYHTRDVHGRESRDIGHKALCPISWQRFDPGTCTQYTEVRRRIALKGASKT